MDFFVATLKNIYMNAILVFTQQSHSLKQNSVEHLNPHVEVFSLTFKYYAMKCTPPPLHEKDTCIISVMYNYPARAVRAG